MRFVIIVASWIVIYMNVCSQTRFFTQLADSAFLLTKNHVIYNPQYCKIKYPNGDVPDNQGDCSDVIIRAYRKLGIDLQKEVHEDMKANFHQYPKIWKLKTTDRNIDHRRVPNLMKFFVRKGKVLKISAQTQDYSSGDIVVWRLSGGIIHIGIVSSIKLNSSYRNFIIHNVGAGQVLEDFLFKHPIIGHYQYQK